MKLDKPKMRLAPSLEAPNEKREAAERLLRLDAWTAVPGNLASDATVSLSTPTAPAPEPPRVPLRPWEAPGADKAHPYHIVCSEALFQKMDFVWKRSGNKSLREWVLAALEREVDEALQLLE